jgi:hypothetical protein
MIYISDSLMRWRQQTPEELIATGESFQLLTHPVYWTAEFDSADEALASAESADLEAVKSRYRQVREYYADLLRNRAALDAKFKQERSEQEGFSVQTGNPSS